MATTTTLFVVVVVAATPSRPAEEREPSHEQEIQIHISLCDFYRTPAGGGCVYDRIYYDLLDFLVYSVCV